jgi:hypothetical protein
MLYIKHIRLAKSSRRAQTARAVIAKILHPYTILFVCVSLSLFVHACVFLCRLIFHYARRRCAHRVSRLLDGLQLFTYIHPFQVLDSLSHSAKRDERVAYALARHLTKMMMDPASEPRL